jgi:prepilin-type N-terminal cleavage/methylation domain-containing protein
MLTKLRNKNEGFTIIEVLIVLAIAGLILLIVFLAVPALRRNARNTQRTDDAAKVGAQVSECLNNRNGQVGACDTVAEVAFDPAAFAIMTGYTVANGGAGVFSQTSAHVIIGVRCNANGDNVAPGNARDVAVTWQNETGTGTQNRCTVV